MSVHKVYYDIGGLQFTKMVYVIHPNGTIRTELTTDDGIHSVDIYWRDGLLACIDVSKKGHRDVDGKTIFGTIDSAYCYMGGLWFAPKSKELKYLKTIRKYFFENEKSVLETVLDCEMLSSLAV